MNGYKFIINKPVQVEETRHYEFKEVKGKNPLDSIKNTCDVYVVAFLNSDGGRIFWGIRDSDRLAVGVKLTLEERDDVRKTVTSKLSQIQPPISPTAYQVNLHPIFEDESSDKLIEGSFVVEIVAPKVFNNDLYSTGSGDVFVKTDSGKKKLSFQEIQDEIRRRHIQKESSPVVQKERSDEIQSDFVIELLIAEDGLIAKDESELNAVVAEALYAADSKQKITFELDYKPLSIIRSGIELLENTELNAEKRLHKVRLLNLAKNYEENLSTLKQTMPLLFERSVRNLIPFSDEKSISLGLQSLALEVFGKGIWSYANDRYGIDIFRKTDPKMHTVIWINDDEAKEIEGRTRLQSIHFLMGNGGWDIFDLPRNTLIEKAIPAIILEVNRIERKHGLSINLKDILNFGEWHIGLH
jgi:hypothetical protein